MHFTEREKKSMATSKHFSPNIVNLLGYWLSDCNLNRDPFDDISRITVSLTNYELNAESKQFTITYQVQLFSHEGKQSVMQYKAVFNIGNDSFINDFLKKIDDSNYKLQPESNEFIVLMIQISFPYVRQSLSNLTNDFCETINLPIINANELIEKSLEFKKTIPSIGE